MDLAPNKAAAELHDQHVSGFYANILLSVLRGLLPAQAVQDVLVRAEETRTLDELELVSYLEHLRPVPATARRGRANVGRGASRPDDCSGLLQVRRRRHGPNNPGARFTREVFISGAGTNPLLPIRRYEMTEVGEREWTIREWFLDGFAPYDEFCRFVAGQYSEIPMFFGLPAAEVVELECQCRGDAACLFRNSLERSRRGGDAGRLLRGSQQGARGPSRATAGDGHRPRLQ